MDRARSVVWCIAAESNERMFYRIPIYNHSEAKYFFIYEDTGEPCPTLYDYAAPFSSELAMVGNNGKIGCIDRSGKNIIRLEFDDGGSFRSGNAVVKKEELWGIIDKHGVYIVKPIYSLAEDYSNDVAWVQNASGLWGVVDTSGHQCIDHIYEDYVPFGNDRGWGLKGNYWFLLDKKGNVISRESRTSNPINFMERVSVIVDRGMSFFVDTDGKRIIQRGYNSAGSFSGGLAPVLGDNGYFFVDRKGAVAIKGPFLEANKFYDNIAVVKCQTGVFGAIDGSGKQVIPYSYLSLSDFCFGLASFELASGEYGLISSDGRVLFSRKSKNLTQTQIVVDKGRLETSVWVRNEYGTPDSIKKVNIYKGANYGVTVGLYEKLLQRGTGDFEVVTQWHYNKNQQKKHMYFWFQADANGTLIVFSSLLAPHNIKF